MVVIPLKSYETSIFKQHPRKKCVMIYESTLCVSFISYIYKLLIRWTLWFITRTLILITVWNLSFKMLFGYLSFPCGGIDLHQKNNILLLFYWNAKDIGTSFLENECYPVIYNKIKLLSSSKARFFVLPGWPSG